MTERGIPTGDHEALAEWARRQQQLLTSISDFAASITRIRDRAEALQELVSKSRLLLQVDMVYLSLNGTDGSGYTSIIATDGVWGEEYRTLRMPLGAGVLGRVAKSGTAAQSADYGEDRALVHDPEVDRIVASEGVRAILGAPMRSEGRVMGALMAANRFPGRFSQEQTFIAQTLANLAGVAVENQARVEALDARILALQGEAAGLSSQLESEQRLGRIDEVLLSVMSRGAGFTELGEGLSRVFGREVQLVDLSVRHDLRNAVANIDEVERSLVLRSAVAQAPVVARGEGGSAFAVMAAVRDEEPIGAVVVEGASLSGSAKGDSTLGRSSEGDKTSRDSTMGNATLGNATLGNATLGDATLGDSTSGLSTKRDVFVGDAAQSILSEVDSTLLERCARALEVFLSAQHRERSAIARRRRELIAQLLAAGARGLNIAATNQLRELAIRESEPFRILVVDGSSTALSDFQHRLDLDFGLSLLYGEFDGQLVSLMPEEAFERVREMVDARGARGWGGMLVGHSPRLHMLSIVPEEYALVLRVVAAARQTARAEQSQVLVSLDSYGAIGAFLNKVTIEPTKRAIADALGPVLDYDREHGTDLADTAAAFLDSGHSIAKTATALRVHTNTVRQRLDRLAKLLGTDWAEGQRGLDHHILLAANRLVGP